MTRPKRSSMISSAGPLCPALLALLLLLSVSPVSVFAQVRINELLPVNDRTNVDEEGDSSDWVELYNAGPASVDLKGYGLSDDPRRPRKWVFPEFELGAGEYLLVWCSGKDRFSAAREVVLQRSSPVPLRPTIISLDAEWRYMYGSAEDAEAALPLPDGWFDPEFDDRAWAVGKPGFGFGDDDDVTVLPSDIGAVLLRHRFRVTEGQAAAPIYLQVDYDDAFVLYLNGTLVLDVNRRDPEEPLHFGSRAASSHEANGRPERWDFSEHRELFRIDTGEDGASVENVIAIVLLNQRVTSNDLSLTPELGTIPPLFHTNFELSGDGEEVLVADPENAVIDAVDVPPQNADRSYGRVAPGQGAFFYLLTPTPGATNDSPFSVEPISARPEMTPEAGEYDAAVSVELAASFPFDDFEIRYSTDGSPPDAESRLYEEPIDVTRGRVLRAAVFREGEQISQTTTQSYFIKAARYDLPILSIAMDPAVFRDLHERNTGARGPTSEREGHVEVVEAGGDVVASTGMGLRLHGGAGRQGPLSIKKAYRMYFRGVYGDRKLNYRLIPETQVDVFDKVVLRSNFNDAFRTGQDASLLRDELIRDLHEDMGYLVSHGAWYNIFINMQYRGVYNVVERMDKDFFYSYFPEDGEDGWWVVKTGDDVLDGGVEASRAWLEAKAALRVNLRDDAVYEEATRLIDVENYTSYMILNIWAQNHDWPHNNWYVARPAREGGQWIFLSWDAEFGIGRVPSGYSTDTLAHLMSRRDSSIGSIFGGLITNDGYQRYFVEEVERHLSGVLAPEHVLSRIDDLVAIVEPDIPEERTLPSPSGGFSLSRWQGNIRTMQTFARLRGDIMRRFVFQSQYITLPRVYSVSPKRVTVGAEETELTVRGRGMDAETKVFFNGIPSPRVVRESSSKYMVVLPFDLRVEGKPVITVERSGAEGLPAYDLVEVTFVRPRVTSIIPERGSALGGDRVLVVGENFGEGARVEFNGIAAPEVELLDISGTTLGVVTPPGVAGTAAVRVINTRPGDLSSEETIPFTYLPSGVVFRRGDANGDGRTNLPDAIAILGFLFGGAGTPSCEDALDVDDSGTVDLTDGLYLLDYLFGTASPPPAPPFAACGADETTDGLSCGAQRGC